MLHELKAADWDALPVLSDPIATIAMTATGEDGSELLPRVGLAAFRTAPERMVGANARVLQTPEVTLLLDYPMATPALRVLHAADAKGFSRAELMAAILSTYQAVYDSARLTGSVAKHDIDDLGVSSIEVFKVEGAIWLVPVIES